MGWGSVRSSRRRRIALAALYCAWAAGFTDAANAGAWLQPSGRGQIIFSNTFTSSPRGFDETGRTAHIADYRKFEFSPALEYGLTDDLTLVAQPQLRSVSIGAPTEARYTGPGYGEIGARVRLWSDKSSIVSAQVTARIAGSREASDPAQAGNADDELDMRALYGRGFSLGAWPSFLDAQLAYRLRGGEAADQVRVDVTLGTRPRPDLLLMAQSFNTFSTDPTPRVLDTGREHKVELSIVWDATSHLSLQFGGVATVAGRNALAERGIVAAAWWRF